MTDNSFDTMFFAVIQAQDTDPAEEALNQLGTPVQKLPSVGSFLGRRNSTLIIALDSNQKQQVLNTLKTTCRQRIEYIAIPLESAPLPLPTPTPVSIGGATVFSLGIDHYEEV